MPYAFNPFTANFDYYQTGTTNPHPGSDIEQESSFFLLQEDGTSSIQEEA